MSILNSARSAMGNAWRGAKATAGWGMTSGVMSGASMWNAASPLKRMGAMAGAGALYGGTIGRDPGQSRLGGAMTGAMGGAAMYGAGRYAKAGMRGFQIGRARGMQGTAQFSAAGRGAFGQMARDAKRAEAFIGNSGVKSNAGINKISSSMKNTSGITKFSHGPASKRSSPVGGKPGSWWSQL